MHEPAPGLPDLFALGAALGADAFSLSLALGLHGIGKRRCAAVALLFGGSCGILFVAGFYASHGFHSLMDLGAWWALEGRPAAEFGLVTATGADWMEARREGRSVLALLGASILAGLGLSSIWPRPRKRREAWFKALTGWRGLLALAGLASFDAFVAGGGIGMIDAASWWPGAGIVGAVTAAMAWSGAWLGRRSPLTGRGVEVAGAILLWIVACRIWFMYR